MFSTRLILNWISPIALSFIDSPPSFHFFSLRELPLPPYMVCQVERVICTVTTEHSSSWHQLCWGHAVQLGVVAPHRVCQGVGTHGVGATSEPVGATLKSWGEEATDARALFL